MVRSDKLSERNDKVLAPLHIERAMWGKLYVVGDGVVCPVDSHFEGECLIDRLTIGRTFGRESLERRIEERIGVRKEAMKTINRRFSNTTIKGFKRIHAKKRFRERYGVELSATDYDAMIETIKTGQAHLLRKLTLTRAIFNLKHNGGDVFALYSSSSKRIITFLTLSQIYEKYERRVTENGK